MMQGKVFLWTQATGPPELLHLHISLLPQEFYGFHVSFTMFMEIMNIDQFPAF